MYIFHPEYGICLPSTSSRYFISIRTICEWIVCIWQGFSSFFLNPMIDWEGPSYTYCTYSRPPSSSSLLPSRSLPLLPPSLARGSTREREERGGLLIKGASGGGLIRNGALHVRSSFLPQPRPLSLTLFFFLHFLLPPTSCALSNPFSLSLSLSLSLGVYTFCTKGTRNPSFFLSLSSRTRATWRRREGEKSGWGWGESPDLLRDSTEMPWQKRTLPISEK